jgi:hypothetical protein
VEETARDVLSWSESPKSLPPDAACDSDDPYQGEPWDEYYEGYLCEDVDVFETLVAEGNFTVRKTTTKKGKKIQAMDKALDAKDLMDQQAISGKKHHNVSHRPPSGKKWLKQIFAGQMGLTVMAIFYGMSVGIPLDSLTSDWDATSKKAMPRVHQDMKEEDPYLTVITHPCGPWGNWGNFNIARGGQAEATVLELRESQRPLLKLVNIIIVGRVKACRHVFVEQPYGSESINEPEMTDMRKLIEAGRLLMIKVDGCQLGYKDRESQLPHKKTSSTSHRCWRPRAFLLTLFAVAPSMNHSRVTTSLAPEPSKQPNGLHSSIKRSLNVCCNRQRLNQQLTSKQSC